MRSGEAVGGSPGETNGGEFPTEKRTGKVSFAKSEDESRSLHAGADSDDACTIAESCPRTQQTKLSRWGVGVL
jgi:hypothetical protein